MFIYTWDNKKGNVMRKDVSDRKKYDDDYYQRNKERKKEYARQRRLLLGTKVLAEQQLMKRLLRNCLNLVVLVLDWVSNLVQIAYYRQ